MRAIVHAEDLANDLQIASVTLLPIFMAEHEYGLTTRLLIFRQKIPAKEWFYPQYVKEVCGDHSGLHALRLLASVQNEVHGVVLNHLHRPSLIAVILKFLNRKTQAVNVAKASLLVQHDQTFSFPIREGTQQYAINHAEDGGIGTNAQSQSYYRRECKGGIPAQHS
jgi:hypothetical protein